ncbi:N-acetyl sugar amidotransferase [Ramlibacter sp.]|uniref:N-acetyl sugar amidotransferase n=1 Tax=Ramlibacter sp. TaxID=1917967 RepID=UPI003D09C3ED
MADRPYQICTNCIMDTSDSTITFDERGWCEYCQNFHTNIKPNWHPDERGIQEITPLIEKIKQEGKGRAHDCIIGISGGMDSSYVTHVAVKKFGLRPLMFHCDAGWNSDLGVSNIQKLIDALNLDLVTEVINWEEMKDLQRAFFRSQVPFQDQPQDLALFSALYAFAAKEGFKYVITGGNNSTECVRECLEWTYFSTDTRYVKDIHRRFGERPLKTFPMCDILKYKTYYRWVKGMKVVKLLDFYPYNKKRAIQELIDNYGWRPYPMKHYESRFTRFYESFWTPRKFGYDKRRAYFSSEILTGQMTREEALERISRPELDEQTMRQEFEYVATKLDWTVEEFEAIFNGPNKRFSDYANNLWLITLGARISNLLGIDNRIFR